MIAATANWVASQRKIQFATAATNHSALGSDEMRSVEIWSDERSDMNNALGLSLNSMEAVSS